MLAIFYREIAAQLPRAAEDRLHWRRQNHIVEHDGERSPDVLGRVPAKGACAGVVEAEGDDRLAGALIEGGLRIGKLVRR